MQKVLFSNTKIPNFENIEVDSSTTLNETFDKYDEQFKRYKDGNSVFVIYVHCTFKGASNPQDQGGVIIYRKLLEKFKDCQDKLKVIFYSPLTKDKLVEVKPENYVLKCLPFVLWIDPENIEDLENKIKSAIEGDSFPQFNNASENLLSGWAETGAKKIDLQGKKLLVIDDEWQQWKKTYETILKGSIDYFLKDVADIKAEFEKLDNNTFPHSHLDNLADFDLIISDLYLWELHDPNEWKPEDFINSISGFLLFKLIRDIEPAIPVIFHTTSTKFRIYETLSALGADAQIPKNINCEALKIDKTDTYKIFEESIEHSVESYGSCWLNEFYRYISDNTVLTNNLWRRRSDEEKKEIVELIKHAILGYKNLKNYNKDYLNIYFSDKEIDPLSIPAGGVLNILGKIQETLNSNNPELLFLFYLRNLSSHNTNYHLFRLDDVKIALGLLFETLKAVPQRTKLPGQEFVVPFGSKKQPFKYNHQLFHYVHYFNNWNSFIPDELRATFEERLYFYIDKYYSEAWVNLDETGKNTVKNQFKSIQINPSISLDYKSEMVNNKLIIKFKE